MRGRLADVDPALLLPGDCATLVHELAGLGKACAAAVARLAARAAEGGAHRGRGFLDPADWLAAATGSSSTGAKRNLDAIAAVEGCEATRAAVVSGELSLEQGREVAATEAVVPGSERQLLDLARSAPLRRLQDTARQARLRAEDAEQLAARQRRLRSFRHWSDDDGMVRFAGALPSLVGVPFLSRLDAETERGRVAARRNRCEESWEAHAADALAALGSDGGRPARRTNADVVLVCDLAAYRSGRPGHIVGGGPVPNRAVREAIDDDAFLKVAFTDGVDIRTITHLGRHIPAQLRTALELGPPPDFDGVRCACGCGKRHRLQWDHIDPVANGGATCRENLQPLSARDHRDKTRRDRAAGLLSGGRPP